MNSCFLFSRGKVLLTFSFAFVFYLETAPHWQLTWPGWRKTFSRATWRRFPGPRNFWNSDRPWVTSFKSASTLSARPGPILQSSTTIPLRRQTALSPQVWSLNDFFYVKYCLINLPIMKAFLDISKKTQRGSGKNSSNYSQKLKPIC